MSTQDFSMTAENKHKTGTCWHVLMSQMAHHRISQVMRINEVKILIITACAVTLWVQVFVTEMGYYCLWTRDHVNSLTCMVWAWRFHMISWIQNTFRYEKMYLDVSKRHIQMWEHIFGLQMEQGKNLHAGKNHAGYNDKNWYNDFTQNLNDHAEMYPGLQLCADTIVKVNCESLFSTAGWIYDLSAWLIKSIVHLLRFMIFLPSTERINIGVKMRNMMIWSSLRYKSTMVCARSKKGQDEVRWGDVWWDGWSK